MCNVLFLFYCLSTLAMLFWCLPELLHFILNVLNMSKRYLSALWNEHVCIALYLIFTLYLSLLHLYIIFVSLQMHLLSDALT